MEEKKSGIKGWAPDDQPREKLISKGAAALSDSELLAIFIRGGSAGNSAVDIGRQVLNSCRNNLLELGRLSVKDLMKVKGVGEAKAVTLVAALELGRRWYSRRAINNSMLKDSRETERHLRPLIGHYSSEVFGAIYLAQSGKIIQDFEIVSKGGITSTTVDPRLIFRRALELGAVSLIVSHNHPSGSVRPSKADEALTQKILLGGRYMDIKLLDHIIIGDDGYYSFADEGKLG